MRGDINEIYDTYVEIDDDLQLNANIYNALDDIHIVDFPFILR